MAEAPPPLPSTSTSLLAQVQDQDAQAWQRLTQIYGPSVYRWGRSAGLQPADAADVVQDTFQAVARGMQRFRHDAGDSFRAWLWKIFRSKLMDHYRRCKVEPPAEGDSALATQLAGEFSSDLLPSAGEQAEDAARLVQRALEVIRGDFEERVWQAFWRSAVLDERTRDIADALSMKPPAVCMARSRVLKRLRETLEGMGLIDDGESL